MIFALRRSSLLKRWLLLIVFALMFLLFTHDYILDFIYHFKLVDRAMILLGYVPDQKHIYISSAYYARDENVVRSLALAKVAIANWTVYCDADGRVAASVLHYTGHPPHCRWATYLIDCPVLFEPQQFSLVGQGFFGFKHTIPITKPDPTPRTLVVCFARMINFENWQTALSTLELYRLHGVDLMVIPIASVITQLYTILKAYEKSTGRVRLKPAVRIPYFAGMDFDPNSEVDWFNQVTSYTECLYDYRESTEFIIHADLDDVIIPRYHFDLPTELAFLAQRYPKAASIEFQWATLKLRTSNSPAAYSIGQIIRDNYVFKVFDYGKSVVRPRRIRQSFIHHPTHDPHILPGYEHIVLGSNETMAIHFRELVFDKTKAIPPSNTYFANYSIYNNIDEQFNSFLDENPEAKLAFYRLPTKNHYLQSMDECYRIIRRDYRNNILNTCPSPIQCGPPANNNLPPCMILYNKWDFTRFALDLQVASPRSAEIIPHSNCFLL